MKKSKKSSKGLWAVAAVAVVIVGAYFLMGQQPGEQSVETGPAPQGRAMVTVKLPAELSAKAKLGELAFNAKCAVCHGSNGEGQNGVAPPLVHRTYEPNHHSDLAFVRAAQNGVRSHHWTFGNMPPIEGLTDGDILNIATYIRELQRENGIR